MILVAQDKTGVWKPVEYFSHSRWVQLERARAEIAANQQDERTVQMGYGREQALKQWKNAR